MYERILRLFPPPREVRVADREQIPDQTAIERHVAALPRQGYRLVINDGIQLEYADEPGRRYGLDTLEQLRTHHPEGLPCLEILDHPAFAVRGFMLDVSRGRVPTRDTLAELVQVLAAARYNQLQLYVEHAFAYLDHEPVWRDSSPLTGDDIRWLDRRCAEHGIELVPNQNLFGHMETWFAAGPRYLARAEQPCVAAKTSTLAPSPQNLEFAHDLLDELLPHFSSRQVHIGCDETGELGLGVSRDRVARDGVGRVYVDHLLGLARPLIDQGYRVQFWGDIVNSHPDLVTELPPELIPIAWWYERPYADLLDDLPQPFAQWLTGHRDRALLIDGFAERTASFKAAGRPFWVAPGTGAWASLLGRTTNAYANLADASRYASPGCQGYLVTHWGDLGSWEHPSIAYPPALYGGAVSWNPDSDPREQTRHTLSTRIFDDRTGRIAAALDLIGNLWERLGVPAFNLSPLFSALTGAGMTVEPAPGAARDVLAELTAAEGLLAAARPGSRGAVASTELTSALALARFGLETAVPSGRTSDGRGPELRELLAGHIRCWLVRARPGGLLRSLSVARPTLSRYRIEPETLLAEGTDYHRRC